MITIDDITILNPQTHKNMAVLPLRSPSSYKIDILTLKKGFELGLVEVKECEQSTVNTLIVKNNSVNPLLLVDGEEIIGGDQNRIVNATILIAPTSEKMIPVNCTEHGRWGYKHEFRQSEHMANYRTRSQKEMAKRQNLNEQQAVWDSISELEYSREFHSPTQAMSESYDNVKIDLNEALNDFKIEDGQNGVVVIVDGEIKGFEVFLNPQIYREYHEKILKSYIIDTDINDSVFTIDTDEAKSVIADALNSDFVNGKNNGLEEVLDFENKDGFGKIYTYEDEIIHMSYFMNVSDATSIKDDSKEPTGERIIF